jgi:hypothetical protein
MKITGNAHPHTVAIASRTNYVYDVNGSMTSAGCLLITNDAENHPMLMASTRRRKSCAGYDQRRTLRPRSGQATKDEIAIGRWSFVLGLSNQQPTSAELY